MPWGVYDSSGALKKSTSATSHDHTLHTNRSRSIWIPARGGGLSADTSNADTVGSSPDLVNVVRHDDGATDESYGSFLLPYDAVTGAVTVRIKFSMAGTSGTPSIRVNFGYLNISSANPASANTMLGASTHVATSTIITQNVDFTIPSVAAGELFKFIFQRVGGNAADTYAENMRVLGAEIIYTADS